MTRLIKPLLVTIVTVVIIVIVAMAFTFITARLSKGLVSNSTALNDLRFSTKLKALGDSEPQETLRRYILEKTAVGRLDHVDDASRFPPHPSVDDLMGLTVGHGNAWGVPSDSWLRAEHPVDMLIQPHRQHLIHHQQKARLNAIGIAKVKEFTDAIMGKNVSNRIKKMKASLIKEDESQRNLFNFIFGHRSKSLVEDGSAHYSRSTLDDSQFSSNIELSVFNEEGYCSDPVPAEEGKTCSETCVSFNAKRLKAPFISNGTIVIPGLDNGSDASKDYCWVGPGGHAGAAPATAVNDDDVPYSINDAGYQSEHHRSERYYRPCSTETAVLVLTDDGGWQCRPSYPTLFGGPYGTRKTACRYNAAIHKSDKTLYDENVKYVDYESGAEIATHADLPNATFLKMLAATSNIQEYKRLASLKDHMYNHPVLCQCSGQLDVFGNEILDIEQSCLMKFYGMQDCVSNPCYMTKVSKHFGKYNATVGTCQTTPTTPVGTMHAIVGDERMPLVGSVPAMGLVVADETARIDGVERLHFANNSSTAAATYNEEHAKRVTRLAAPVIPAENLDSTNASRNVLYVPVPSIVLGGSDRPIIRPSSAVHMTCLPPMHITSRPGEFEEPFSTAAFYVEPVADILGGVIPQKPYEHDMINAEALRNSRLISGNVLGGSETLFSLLLSHSQNHSSSSYNSPGKMRLEKIRKYYQTFFTKRRLSVVEYISKVVLDNSLKDNTSPLLQISESESFSPWDIIFKREDFRRHSVQSQFETFVLREGLMLRSYGPYAGMVLGSSLYNMNLMQNMTAFGISDYIPVNPLQTAFPTSFNYLPCIGSDDDIFSVDSTELFDTDTMQSYFDNYKIRYLTSPLILKEGEVILPLSADDLDKLSDYRVSMDDDEWGLQKFRLDLKPRGGLYENLDKRLAFDPLRINVSPRGCTITPLSMFKKSLIEWGHPDGDISTWFDPNIDTTHSSRRALTETSLVLRNMWFTAAWENDRYYYVKNS